MGDTTTQTSLAEAAGLVTPQQVEQRLAEATSRAYKRMTSRHQRDPHKVGISDLHRCTRRVAYALARVPPSDEPPVREAREANLGTWEHDGFLPLLAQELAAELGEAETEVPVRLRAGGLNLPGRIDLDWSPVGPVDLKTTGEYRLAGVISHGEPYASHRGQVRAYALARLQTGRETPYLGWHYMDRANGADKIVVRRFTNADALAVVDRVETLRAFAEQDPDAAPADERGPGLSFECDECPFLRRCWGEDAEPGVPGAQAKLVRDDEDAAQALAAYVQARETAAAAEKVKKDMEARLSRTKFATYRWPGKPEVGISYGRSRNTTTVDAAEAVRLLQEMGVAVPSKPKRGQLRITVVDLTNNKEGGK